MSTMTLERKEDGLWLNVAIGTQHGSFNLGHGLRGDGGETLAVQLLREALTRHPEVSEEDVRKLVARFTAVRPCEVPDSAVSDMRAALTAVWHNRPVQEKVDLPLERCLAFRAGALWGMCNPNCGSEPAVLHVSRPSNDYSRAPWEWDRDADSAQEKAEQVAFDEAVKRAGERACGAQTQVPRDLSPGKAWEWMAREMLLAAGNYTTEPAERTQDFLKDPENVLALMKRGAIGIPTVRSMVALRGEVPNGEDAQLARIAELQEQAAERVRVPDMPSREMYEATFEIKQYVAFDRFCRDWQQMLTATPEASSHD